MLITSEPETHLPHKPGYEFITQTVLRTNGPEIHFSLN